MATTTSRLGLYKPTSDGSENANVLTDINNNMDNLDAKIGAVPCTSGTRPASPFNGMYIRETDTLKMYVCTNTVGPVWEQVLFGTPVFANDIVIAAGKVFAAGADLGNPNGFSVQAAAAADDVFRYNVTGDSDYRTIIDSGASGGRIQLGSGAAAPDVLLYRNGVGALKTDGTLSVVGAFDTAASANVGGALTVSGNFNIGSARYRNQLSNTVTVSNTVTKTNVAAMSIPANDMVVGATYRITVWGNASTTGTPTITIRADLNGTQLAQTGAITTASAIGNRMWRAEAYFTCVATGGAGSVRGFLSSQHALTTTSGTVPVNTIDGTAATAVDTTAVSTFSISVQWGTASASNTTTVYVACCERVA